MLRFSRRPAAAAAIRPRLHRLSAFIREEARFLRQWAGQPLVTGAVTASSRALARRMAAYVPEGSTGPVLELGPGSGVVTRALIERGIAPERIIAVEFNPEFCALLRRRFPKITVLRGDAYKLDALLEETTLDAPLSAIVSGLPLFTRPRDQRRALLRAAHDHAAVNAPFIQFSYALVPAVPAETGALTIERSGWVLGNLPPARVWVFRRPT